MFTAWNIEDIIDEIFDESLKKYPPLPEYSVPKEQQVRIDITQMHVKFSDWLNACSLVETKQKMEGYLKGFTEWFESSVTDSYNKRKTRKDNQDEGDLFEYYANILYVRKVLESGLDIEDKPSEFTEELSAVQKLLFIRLLQREKLFPQKALNADNAPELRAIALLTGLNYENQIKGSSGANAKVNQLLNSAERKRITPGQIQSKLDDLDAVEKLARSLYSEPVIDLIATYRNELIKLHRT